MEISNLRERVFRLTQQVPMGKVTTYGEIARAIGTRDARLVGYMLHSNTQPEVPCHRVVDRTGRIAPNFAFDGATEQRHRLEAEGVGFVDMMHVDMKHYFYSFSKSMESN